MGDNMERLEIVFDFASPSGTKFRGKSAWKWLMNYNKRYDKYLQGYHLIGKYNAHEKRTVTITRVVASGREFIKDKENLMFGCKALKDALKRAKLLVDDSMEWLDDYYLQCVGEAKTIVILEWETK
jgi:hypothetical protein